MKQNIRVSMKVASSIQCLFEGEVDIKNNRFQYREQQTNAWTEICILPDGVRIERRDQDTTKLLLQEGKSCLRIVTTEGELEIPDVQFLSCQQNAERMEVFYRIEEERCLQIEYL